MVGWSVIVCPAGMLYCDTVYFDIKCTMINCTLMGYTNMILQFDAKYAP